MRPKIVSIGLGALLATLPFALSADTASDLQAQIDALLKQISVLQEQVANLKGARLFVASPASGAVPVTIAFSYNDIAKNYRVDFGDGSSSAMQKGTNASTVNHTYATAGTYAAKLTLADSATPIVSINIKANGAAAAGGGELAASPTSGKPPLVVTFTASSSESFFGGVKLDFGDGSSTPTCAAGSSCGPKTFIYTYNATGTYGAKLIGTKEGGTTKILDTKSISVDEACTASVTRDLTLGDTDASKGGEVSILQRFLARDSAIYPEGLVTGFFGSATEAAVKRYQKSKNILQTGFVGPITRAAIKTACTGVSTTPYKFGASPISGTAPVEVTFTAVEAETRAGSIWYAVDFGDGERGNMTEIASTSASSTLSVKHTYKKGGTHKARLLQDEDLCGKFGSYSYGCTRELAVDEMEIKITGGVDDTVASGGACKTHKFSRGGAAGASGAGTGTNVPDSQKEIGTSAGGGASAGKGYFPGALPQLASNEFMNYPGSDKIAYAGSPTAAAYLESQFGSPTIVTYPNSAVLQGNPAWWGGQANPGVPPEVGCNLYPRICYIYQCQNGSWMLRSTPQPFGEYMYPNVPRPLDIPNDGRAG